MAEGEEDDDIISEQAEYSPKSEFSKAIHVSEAVKLARENRSKEMKSGYMNSAVDKNGNEVRTWVADTRKIYVASVEALRLLLAPEIKRTKSNDLKSSKDKDGKKIDRKKLNWGSMFGKDWVFSIEKKLIWDKYAFEDFDFKASDKQLSSGHNFEIIKNGTKHLPEIDDAVKSYAIKGGSPVYQKGIWNDKVKCYWNEILELYDKYFSELNILIDELNYFKATINF